MNDEFVKKSSDVTVKLPARADDDGFNDAVVEDRVIIGVKLSCVDGNWAGDGVPMPANTRLLALATTMILQQWRNGNVLETIRPQPGQTLTNLVDLRDDLNEKIDKSTWEIGIGDIPRPPWVLSFILYLLDEHTAEKLTYVNSTTGARIAVLDLKDKVAWMRALRGDNVVAEIELAKRPMKTKHGTKLRPHFEVIGWKLLGSGGGGKAEAPQIEPPRGIKPVEPPTLGEELNDRIAF